MQDKETADKVLTMLRELAGCVGQTAETLWPMAVRATYAEAITALAMGFVGVVAGAALALVSAKKIPPQESQYDFPARELGMALGVAVMLIAAFTSLGCGLPSLIAPEGMTLRLLLGK
jgi:hypothetical protein